MMNDSKRNTCKKTVFYMLVCFTCMNVECMEIPLTERHKDTTGVAPDLVRKTRIGTVSIEMPTQMAERLFEKKPQKLFNEGLYDELRGVMLNRLQLAKNVLFNGQSIKEVPLAHFALMEAEAEYFLDKLKPYINADKNAKKKAKKLAKLSELED